MHFCNPKLCIKIRRIIFHIFKIMFEMRLINEFIYHTHNHIGSLHQKIILDNHKL